MSRRTKTGQKSCGIKSFGLTNQSLKSLGQIKWSMCGEELVKELQNPVSHTHTHTLNHGEGSAMVCGGFAPVGGQIESD